MIKDIIILFELKGTGRCRASGSAVRITSETGIIRQRFGAIAKFERALIRERTSAGLAEARRKGRVGGRPKGMQPKEVAAASALLAESSLTSKEVAARFDVSKAILYRHLGAETSLQKS